MISPAFRNSSALMIATVRWGPPVTSGVMSLSQLRASPLMSPAKPMMVVRFPSAEVRFFTHERDALA